MKQSKKRYNGPSETNELKKERAYLLLFLLLLAAIAAPALILRSCQPKDPKPIFHTSIFHTSIFKPCQL